MSDDLAQEAPTPVASPPACTRHVADSIMAVVRRADSNDDAMTFLLLKSAPTPPTATTTPTHHEQHQGVTVGHNATADATTTTAPRGSTNRAERG